ncbi:hypothetical protein CDV55_105580 [Aspergillus turcosus]|nr:hypothetical protein CDV55_105580 [Aspergillus turcosus]
MVSAKRKGLEGGHDSASHQQKETPGRKRGAKKQKTLPSAPAQTTSAAPDGSVLPQIQASAASSDQASQAPETPTKQPSKHWTDELRISLLVAVLNELDHTFSRQTWHKIAESLKPKKPSITLNSARTPHYPGEDEKLRASSISHRRGGNCPNTLEVLQQLIAHCKTTSKISLNLVAVLPAKASVASQQILAGFGTGVQLKHCIYREQFNEPASSYIIKSQASGSRTIVNYNELPEMTVEEFTAIADKIGSNATFFHFEGRIPEVTLPCIRYLRQSYPSIKISVEAEKPGRPGLQELANEADVVFYAKSWAQGQGYASAEECLRKQWPMTRNASLLCCTWGEDGAVALDTQAGELLHSPAYTAPGFEIVDTIGAGDTFIAGMLYAWLCQENLNLAKKIQFANRVAGMKVGQEGFSGLDKALESF